MWIKYFKARRRRSCKTLSEPVWWLPLKHWREPLITAYHLPAILLPLILSKSGPFTCRQVLHHQVLRRQETLQLSPLILAAPQWMWTTAGVYSLPCSRIVLLVMHGCVIICSIHRQADTTRCLLCNAIVTVHCEEIVTQCVVTLSTALHHMPVLTLRYLVHGINALAKVALPDTFSWDNTKFALACQEMFNVVGFSTAERRIKPIPQPVMYPNSIWSACWRSMETGSYYCTSSSFVSDGVYCWSVLVAH